MNNLFKRSGKSRLSKKAVKRFTSCVAMLVVFSTTYMLILPAIAIDNVTAAAEPGMELETAAVPAAPVLTCIYEPHRHIEECYEERDVLDQDGYPTGEKEKVLICGKSDQLVHEHDASCWEDGVLVCRLPEIKTHEHDETCYETKQVFACDIPEHAHSDACYEEVTVGTERQLVCGYNEGDIIRSAIWSEPVYSEDIYDENGELVQAGELLQPAELIEEEIVHHHDENCYEDIPVTEWQLSCGMEEHIHDADCLKEEKILICDKPEYVLHTHTEDCYEKGPKGESPVEMGWAWYTEENGEQVLEGDPAHRTCEKLELREHVHTEACFCEAIEEIKDSEVPQALYTPEADKKTKSEEEDQGDEQDLPAQEFHGETGDVTVMVTAEEGIFPEGTTMEVTDVVDEEIISSICDAASTDAKNIVKVHAADITFYNKEHKPIEPKKPVKVIMTPKEAVVEEISSNATTSVEVIHVTEEGEAAVVEQTADNNEDAGTGTDTGIAENGEVAFETDAFSVYALVYTVDFEYSVNGKMYQFSLPGGGFVSFTDLVEVLGIIGDTNSDKDGDENGSVIAENTEENATNVGTEENGINSDANTALTLGDVEVSEATRKFVADVASVEFSTPSLVDVSKVESETTVGQIKENRGLECEYSAELTKEQIAEINAQTVEAGDWALISVQPFTSEEQLTVTMKDGEVFKIRVTDAQIKKTVIDAKGDTWEITVTYGEDAQIPNGAELKVREILPEDEEYEQYYQQSLEKVGVVNTKAVAEASEEPDLVEETVEATEEVNDPIKTSDLEKEEQTATQTSDYARIFDIEIWADDHKVEPAEDVTVSIKLLDAPGETEATPQVVHFAEDGAELMVLKEKAENSEDEGIQFVTDEFSVYSVVYTVDFSFNINGKEYSFSLEGGDSTSFKEIIERFKILDKENVELFINNISTVEFSNPDYLWNGRLEEDAFAGELKEKNNLDIQYASNIREGNILAMNVHHYSAPDWVLIALKPFSSEETLSITMKNGEKFTVKVTDAQSDAVHNTDGTVQTIPNPQGTTFELFNYYVSEDTKTTAGRDQWPGHIHDDNEFWKFNWYNFDGSYARSWNDGFWYNGAEVPETWRQQHLLGYGNNLGINKNHNFKFSPANAGTVIDGTKGTVTKDVDGGSGLNGWTQDADPNQGIVQGTLVNGYPAMTTNPSLGTDGSSLAYLFDSSTQEGKDSYGNVNNLLYVDPDGYYTYDSRDFSATYQDGGFVLRDQPDSATQEERGYWPFGTNVYWSGLHMNTQFSMPENGQVLNPKDELKDMQFEFSGDDDTWLYVDGVLVGDGGGIHNRTEIDINFATGKVTVTGKKDSAHMGSFEETKWLDDIFRAAGKYNEADWEDIGDGSGHKRFKAGTYHTFDMFYLERGGGESNLYIHYNLVSTDDFTGHKSYEGFAEDERMTRDQFRFEMIGLDGQYQSVWNSATQTAEITLLDSGGRAIMPSRGNESGDGTFADPMKVYSSSAYTDSNGVIHGGTVLTTGVLENGDIRFGSAEISAEEMLACDQGHPSLYRYIIREKVPDDAVNEDGITWAVADDTQRKAGGFVKDQVKYDKKVYYMTARVTSWDQTGADGQTYKAYGLSKSYYKDDTFTEVDNDISFVDFRNLYAPDSGSVEFLKVNGMGNPLAGATFTLYTDETCTKVAKNLEGTEQVVTTESDGKVVFDNMAAPKTYYMKETGVPTGYQANNTVYKVTIEDSKDTTKTSKIIVNGDETEATITQIINTKPGEISVVKKWVDPSGKEVAGGNNTAKVQLRRYNPVLHGGGSTHNVTVKMSYTDYNNNSGTWEKTVPISGSTAIITWKVLDGADAQSVFDGYDDTGWQENPRATILYRTVSVNSDVTVNLELKQYWPVGNGKFNFDNDLIVTGSGSSETIDYQVDTSFPSTADTEATQVLSISNNWTYTWTIGDGDSYDFPATDGTNPYLYYLVELKPDDTEVAIDGEVQEGITLREISYSPSLTENAGIQQGVITVKNEVTAQATTDIVIKKYKKDDLNNASAETLKGATFRLEKYTSSDYQGKDTGWSEQTVEDTEETGIFNFTDLEEGFYKIVEVDTPDGYIKISTDPTFEVRNVSGQLEVIFTDTNLVTYTPENGFRFGNEPGATLPNTGGSGTRIFTILGSILILGAGALLLWRRRRFI